MQNHSFIVAQSSEETFHFEFDRIYAGYVTVSVRTFGEVEITVECSERDSDRCNIPDLTEHMILNGNTEYIGLQLRSSGY